MPAKIHQIVENNILTLLLDHPERANALTHTMIAELIGAIKQAERDETIRCIVLRGAGNAFCSGQDVTEMLMADTISYREHLQKTYNPLVLALRQIEKPVIASIHGAVAGAGLGIALACDLRIAAEDAKFTLGFLRLGLIPDAGLSALLVAHLGLSRALGWALTNQVIDAQQAHSWGLVHQVVSPQKILDETNILANQLAQSPTKAIGLTKRVFNHSALANLENLLDYEAHLQEIARTSEEHRRGVQAFLAQKSNPSPNG